MSKAELECDGRHGPEDADQNQRFALFRGEQFEGVAKLDDLKSAVLLRQRRERFGIGAIDVLNLAPTLAVFRAEQVAGW